MQIYHTCEGHLELCYFILSMTNEYNSKGHDNAVLTVS